MDARPKFSGFGISREYYAQDHANSDDIPILDGFFKKMLDELDGGRGHRLVFRSSVPGTDASAGRDRDG